MRLRVFCFCLVLLLAARAAAADPWPNLSDLSKLSDIGIGVAVIFSPDLAREGNRQFYERLGFTYIEHPDWRVVIKTLRDHNSDQARRPISHVVVETHGANGNGLKLQTGKNRKDARSYIAVGALQEALDMMNVRGCYLSACNAGRLLRPEIYAALNRKVKDPAFLPPTLTILDASPEFDPSKSSVAVLRRTQSNLETLIHGSTSELGEAARELIVTGDEESPFVISTMLIQLVLNDRSLELTSGGYVRTHSRNDIPKLQSERLFQLFLQRLNEVSAREISGETLQVRAQRSAARASGSN